MLVLVSAEKLEFEFSLGQREANVLDGLRQSFIEKYGEEIYTKSAMIIVREENFFNIIKDIYGVPYIGHHNDFLDETIEKHLET